MKTLSVIPAKAGIQHRASTRQKTSLPFGGGLGWGWLRNHPAFANYAKRLSILIAILLLSLPTHAAEKPAIESTARTILAYIITGNRATDAISQSGLTALSRVLTHRTSLDDIGVVGVDPSSDDLAFYPLLYWPIANTSPLPPEAATRINNYLRYGGMILFDTGPTAILDGTTSPQALRGIDMPPLAKLPPNHVLTRSFYLLHNLPGRFVEKDVWIEATPNPANDGVASVIVGGNSWAEAWAANDNSDFQFACVPGGEPQREQAFRFGVNLVMYALTGNYKADQLHAKALLERTGE